MKKILIMFLSLAIGLGALVGCAVGGGEQSSDVSGVSQEEFVQMLADLKAGLLASDELNSYGQAYKGLLYQLHGRRHFVGFAQLAPHQEVRGHCLR